MNKQIIRFATIEDTSTILRMIQQLAEFEKLSKEVIATENNLKTTLFGERPFAEVLLLEHHQTTEVTPVIAGFALFFHNYSTFLAKPGIYLEDLFVLPEYRGHGFGKKLLIHLASIAIQRNCGRLDWSVLDWNTEAIRFYENLGAKQMNDWTGCRLTGSALENLAKQDINEN